jgi:predicted ATPase
MLKHLTIENFKAWKKADMRLAPLTGLFGANSSGKTSILQFLLMLKQTVESPDESLVLNLKGNYVDLGTFYDIISEHDLKNELVFKIDWLDKVFKSSSLSNPDKLSFNCRINEFNNNLKALNVSHSLNNVSYEIIDKHDSDKKKEIVIHDSHGIERMNDIFEFVKFYDIRKNVNVTIYNKRRDPISFMSLVVFFEHLFKQIHYLGPLREPPKRVYQWGGERRSLLGNRGEFVIEAILGAQERGEDIEHEGKKYSLDAYLAFWLRELGLIQDFQIAPITEGGRWYEVKVRLTAKSPYVLLTDIGFGVSQILPVLTLCFFTPKGSILLIEQPEIHLHPRVQAGLADVFIDAIEKRGVQIILESHSEHLLRRLQRRIAEGTYNSDNAALYFCNKNEEGYSDLQTLDLDAFGNIKNWPDNFFGDEMNEMFQMSEAIFERKKRAKQNGQ